MLEGAGAPLACSANFGVFGRGRTVEDEFPVQIVPEDEQTRRAEAAFVEAMTGGVGQALLDTAGLIALLLTEADPQAERSDGATPSEQAPRRSQRP